MAEPRLLLKLRPHAVGMRWELGPGQQPGLDVVIWKDEAKNALEIEVTTLETKRCTSESWRPQVSESWKLPGNWPPTEGEVRLGYSGPAVVSYSDMVRNSSRTHLDPKNPAKSHQNIHQQHQGARIPEPKSSAQVLQEAQPRVNRKRDKTRKPQNPENTKWNKNKNSKNSENHLKQQSSDPTKIAPPNPVKSKGKNNKDLKKPAPTKPVLGVVNRKLSPKKTEEVVPLDENKETPEVDAWTVVSYPRRRTLSEESHQKRLQKTVPSRQDKRSKNSKSSTPQGNRFSILQEPRGDHIVLLDPLESITPPVPINSEVDSESKKKSDHSEEILQKSENDEKVEQKAESNGIKDGERITGGAKIQTNEDIKKAKRMVMEKTSDSGEIICRMPVPSKETLKCCYPGCDKVTTAGIGAPDLRHMSDHIYQKHGKKVKWEYDCSIAGCEEKSKGNAPSGHTRWVKEHMKVHSIEAKPRFKPQKTLNDTTMEILESQAPSLSQSVKATKMKTSPLKMVHETPEKKEGKMDMGRMQTRSVTKLLSTMKVPVAKKSEESEVEVEDKQQLKLADVFTRKTAPRKSLSAALKAAEDTGSGQTSFADLKGITGPERVKMVREMTSRQGRLSTHTQRLSLVFPKSGPNATSTPKEKKKEVEEGKMEDETPKKEEKKEDENGKKEDEKETHEVYDLSEDSNGEMSRTFVIDDWEPDIRRFNTWCLDHETTSAAWLCDEVVNWYFKDLCAKYDEYKYLDPILWSVWKSERSTESILQRIWSAKTYFFPVCEEDHWILLVFNSTQVWYADSAGGNPKGNVEKFMEELNRDRAWFEFPYPLQRDAVSCGVHVCLMAKSIATGSYWFETSEVQKFRSSFKQTLKEKNYTLYSEPHIRRLQERKSIEESKEESVEDKETTQASIVNTPEKPEPEGTRMEEKEPEKDSDMEKPLDCELAEIPKLMELTVKPPPKVEPKVLPKQAQHQKKTKVKAVKQMERKQKVPTGKPDKLVKSVREWFEREFQLYVKEGRKFQRLEWLTNMLTAAIQKASVGDEQTVEKMGKRSPPLEMGENEMCTQTDVKKKSSDRDIGDAPKPPRNTVSPRNSYWQNRTKTFNAIIGQESKQCEIPIEKLEEFFKKTTSVTNVPKKTLDEVTSRLPKLSIGNWIEDSFATKEVQEALKKTKDTAPGADGLRYHHLRWFDPDCSMLTHIYNECRMHKKIPSHWKEAETILLYKGGDESKPDNWRPISLMPTIYKLYSSLWNRRIRSVGKVMSKCQRGFQEREGCNESIAILRSAIDVAKGGKTDLSVAWLDLTNAFGSVPHELIESTLTAYGYPETVVQVIKDMYDGASIRVKSKKEKSNQIQIKSGVKQGDPISPTLFNMCLESVIRRHLQVAEGHKCITTRIKILAFADDMALLSESKGQLQKELTEMDEDCTPLNLIFKPAKCASLVIQKGMVQKKAELKLKGVPIRNLDENGTYKYLGIQTGSESRISEIELMKKVMKEMEMVKRSNMTPPQKLDCIKCFVLPKMTYMYANSIPKLMELKAFANMVMRGVKIIHHIPVRGSPLEYVQIPVAKGGLGVTCPKITALITFLVSILKKLWSSDKYIRTLYLEYLKTVVMAERKQKTVTVSDLVVYLNDYQSVNKRSFGYNCYTRVREALKSLAKNKTSPLHSIQFVEENGGLVLEVQATEDSKVKKFTEFHLKKLQQLLKGEVNAALLHRFLTEKPVKSEVVHVIQQHPGSNSFVRQGGKVSLACHTWIHSARLNLLYCNYNNYDTSAPKHCRHCGYENETLWHIIGTCKHSWSRWITDRHNAVLNKVKEMIEAGSKKNWKLRIDHEFPQFHRLRPDIFMESPDKKHVIIGDVTCPYEHTTSAMENAWKMKVDKYDKGFQFLREQGRTVTVLPIVIGALGTWWTPTSASLEELGISKSAIRKVIPEMCSTVMEHSKNIYWRHIKGEMYDPKPIYYGYEKPTGQWKRNDNVLSTTD